MLFHARGALLQLRAPPGHSLGPRSFHSAASLRVWASPGAQEPCFTAAGSNGGCELYFYFRQNRSKEGCLGIFQSARSQCVFFNAALRKKGPSPMSGTRCGRGPRRAVALRGSSQRWALWAPGHSVWGEGGISCHIRMSWFLGRSCQVPRPPGLCFGKPPGPELGPHTPRGSENPRQRLLS